MSIILHVIKREQYIYLSVQNIRMFATKIIFMIAVIVMNIHLFIFYYSNFILFYLFVLSCLYLYLILFFICILYYYF